MARVEGVGPIASGSTDGVSLHTNSTQTIVCQSIDIKSYGQVHCLTAKDVEIAAGSLISVYLEKERNYHACEGSDSTLC